MNLRTIPIVPPAAIETFPFVAEQPEICAEDAASPASDPPSYARMREEHFMIHAGNFSSAIENHLWSRKTPEEQLAFLCSFLHLIELKPTDYLRFSPSAMIAAYGSIAWSAASLRSDLEHAGLTKERSSVIAQLINTAFNAAHLLEQRLIVEGRLIDRALLQMARIHSARAMKVTYEKAAADISAGGRAGPAFLGMAILQAHNSIWRYKQIMGRYPDPRIASTEERRMIFDAMNRLNEIMCDLRDLRERHSIPADDLGWALNIARNLVRSGAKKVVLEAKPEELSRTFHAFGQMISELTTGFYIVSPRILEWCAEAFREAESSELAHIYETRMAFDQKLARLLGVPE